MRCRLAIRFITILALALAVLASALPLAADTASPLAAHPVARTLSPGVARVAGQAEGAEASARVAPPGWLTLAFDDFEGEWPGDWWVVDNNGATGGNVVWGPVTTRSYSPTHSIWCAAGGADGILPEFGQYTNNMDAWMVWGPFDLSQASAAVFDVNYALSAENYYDGFAIVASVDGSSFWGSEYSGLDSSLTWRNAQLDLSAVDGLGNLIGEGAVWLALVFTSDVSITNYGAYVDDVGLYYQPAGDPDIRVEPEALEFHEHLEGPQGASVDGAVAGWAIDEVAGSLAATLALPQELAIASDVAGQLVTFPGMDAFAAPGEPLLPRSYLRFALPPDADPSTLTVALANAIWQDVPGKFDLAPAPPAAMRSEPTEIGWGKDVASIVDGRDVTVYGADATYPEQPVRISNRGEARGLRFVEVEVTPLSYDPLSGRLRRLASADLALSWQPGEPAVLRPLPDDPFSALLINAADVPRLYADTEVSAHSLAPLNAPGYAIITTSYLQAASTQLAAFIAAKEAAGFTVTVVTEGATQTETTYVQGNTTTQRADYIRAWLVDNYVPLNLQYALMLGNPNPYSWDAATSVPMRITAPGSGMTSQPTDMYYADLSSNWNANGNTSIGEWSEIASIDRTSEVIVGRIPYYVSTPEMDAMLAKSIGYQSAPGVPAWRERVIAAAAISNFAPQDENNDGDANDSGEFSNPALRTLAADWASHITTLAGSQEYASFKLLEKSGVYGDGTAYSQDAADAALDTASLLAEWAHGYGYVTWQGHGNYQGAYRAIWEHDNDGPNPPDHITQWGGGATEVVQPSFITSGGLGALDDARPAFVVPVSCLNGQPEQATNLGYSLLNHGAIGVVAAAKSVWYIPGAWAPGATFGGDGYDASYGYWLLQAMLGDHSTMGQALAQQRASVGAGQTVYTWSNALLMNLWGDPSLGLTSTSPGQSVTIYNDGVADLHVTDLANASGSSWLSIVPPAGLPLTVPPAGSRDITVLVDATGLDAGVYADRILISSNDPDENPYPTGVDVTLYVHALCEDAPTTPHTPLPGDAASNVAIDTTLIWQGGHPCADEEVTYDVYLEAGDASPDILVATGLAAPVFDPGGLLNETQYYWQVVSQGLNGPTLGPIWSFETAAPACPPAAPTLNSPADATETCDATPTFSWTPAAETDSVDLQVSDDGFATSVIDINTSLSSHTPVVALPTGSYQWRTRGRNAHGVGTWSEAWALAIIEAPAAPILTEPENEAELCDATPTLTWQAVAGAEGYDVQIADEDAFSAPLLSEAVTGPTFTPLADLAPGEWHWRVRATNACGGGPWSAARAFTVAAAPGAPALIAPADGAAYCAPVQPLFEWADVEHATSYLLRVVGPSQTHTADVSATQHTFAVAFVDPGSYAWSVTTLGDPCPGASSAIRTFSVGVAPGAPVLVAPDDGATVIDPQPTFEWQAVADASSYRFILDDEPTLTAPHLLDETLADTSLTPSAPLVSGMYHWQVVAGNACGAGAASPVRAIELVAGPPAPTPLSPFNGARLYPEFGPITFAWEPVEGALSYTLQIVGETDEPTPAHYERQESTDDTSLALADLPLGAYTWRAQTTGDLGVGPWSETRALDLALFVPIRQIMLPIVLDRHVASKTIAGQVTVDGLPAEGLEIALHYSDGGAWSTADVATTGVGGEFEFAVAAPEGEAAYHVRWENDTLDDTLLSLWVCDTVSATSAYPDDYRFAIELRNIGLQSPAPEAEVILPATLEWTTRGDPDEDYEVNLAKIDLTPYWHQRVGYAADYTLTALPPGFILDEDYIWWLWVYGDSGYGVSHYANPIRFVDGGAAGAAMTAGDSGKNISEGQRLLPRRLSLREDE